MTEAIEKTAFVKLETTAEKAFEKLKESGWEFAIALAAIHDSKLYPGYGEPKGWEHYVVSRWKIGKVYAYRLISWVRHEIELTPVLEELPAGNCAGKPPVTPTHKTERASRAARNGEKPKTRSPEPRKNEDLVREWYKQGKSAGEISELVKPLGTQSRRVDEIIRETKIRAEVEAQIKPEDLDLSQQKKLETAIRQHKQKLDDEFAVKVQEAVNRCLESRTESWSKERALHEQVMKGRRGCLTKKSFNLIRSCLHPDALWSLMDEEQKKVFTDAFVAFNALEKLLLDEKNSPTTFMKIPRNRKEWEKKP